MSWNPQTNIALFEPGCIICDVCGAKPEDGWDPNPDGFQYYSDEEQWECDECAQALLVKNFFED